MTAFRAFVVDHWFGLLAALIGLGLLVWASGLLHPAEKPPRTPREPRRMRHTIVPPVCPLCGKSESAHPGGVYCPPEAA